MKPILKIDLSNETVKSMSIPAEWVREYIGGAPLAARILYDHISLEIDPLSEAASLLFLNGPLTGTAGPAVGRFVICARSPETRIWGESNIGGFWGPELRQAGFDGVWLTGKADKPVIIQVNDSEVQILSAEKYWGMETYQAQESIRKDLGSGLRIVTIGPAGERNIPLALVLSDHGRVAGRTGMGAVMGSKNLKAIAVKGSGKVKVESSVYDQLRSDTNKLLRDDNMTRATRELGSAGAADYLDYLGEMPKKYFTTGVFEGVHNVTGATMAETILAGVSACHACVIACGRVVSLDGDSKQKGPEYETIVGFGPNLLIDDLSFATRMGDFCDRYGLDAISLSNTIGLAFLLFEKEFITSEDTGGVELIWGNQDAVEELINQVMDDRDLGKHIVKGALMLAEFFGAAEFACQVNGLEVPYHDPRAASGMAISYATSPRGACHNQSDYFMIDALGQVEEDLGLSYFDRHEGSDKVSNVVIHQNWRTLNNALILCHFSNVEPTMIRDLVNSALGMNLTIDDLLTTGERGWTLKRIINNRLGVTRFNDTLPKILLVPYQEGGAEGYMLPFDEMMDEYYNVRRWNNTTGFPEGELIDELNLAWIRSEAGSNFGNEEVQL